MNARLRAPRRPTFLACAALAIGTACASESDARDAGTPTDVPRPVDAVATDAGVTDAGVTDVGVTDAGVAPTDSPRVDAPPADAGALRAVSLAASSAGHACVAMSDGTVRCWGLNDSGQIGVAPAASTTRCRIRDRVPAETLPCETRPRAVAGVTDARQIATGNGATCVLRADASVWCWGLNDGGQIGIGTPSLTPTPTPTRVDLPPARQVALGTHHGCALLVDGTVRCWGVNRFGQVGLAVASSTAQCDPGDGDRIACVPTPVAVAGLANVAQLSLGRNHSCARLTDGTVRCWGLNDAAQLGLGRLDPSTPQIAPAAVPGVTGVAEVGAGGSHSCTRGTDGSLRCWGWADLGQLGGAPTTSCDTVSGAVQCAQSPVVVPGVTGVASLSTGRFHTCVALTGGAVRCFGRDDNGQLGAGSASTNRCVLRPDSFACSLVPRDVSIIGAASVSVGDYHSCALTRDGAVRCWGYNAFGQVGDGNTDDRNAPVAVTLVP